MAKPSGCSVCETKLSLDYLNLRHGDESFRLCSFGCLVDFCVQHIRERRQQHNEQLATLRARLSKAQKAKARKRNDLMPQNLR
jgi:hypothetical protein